MGNTTWDHDKDKRLLVTILNISGAVLDYEAIATKMGDCSAEAVRQHLRALNRKNGDEAKDAPVTPTGTKAGTKATPKSSGRGHKKKAEEETPTKAADDKTPVKRKRGRPSKAEKAKEAEEAPEKENEAEPQKESTEEKEEDDTSEGPKKIAKLEKTPAPAAPAEEA
ncbi:hypothetical protein NUU61_001057 [Penicillium alfredii]|uniref:Uncharacterized protein n=1 Tax=Penicillium alfredii TaxID=1506179 RepID=A0A9W9GAT3_9EURO|nr:uncharacterized protein NUU61_001057 [Penicillium alfredii]KAJ5115298.1 hypothetical protein NUU61_001057 [Penicillium alfredii]